MKFQRIIINVFFILMLSCGKYSSKSNIPPLKKWTIVQSVDNSKPIARHEAAFVNVGDNIYLIGGRGVKNVSIYNVKTNKWSIGAKPPLEFHHFQPVVYGSKIYIIQALTGKYPSETPVNHIYTYNTANDIWEKGIEIPKDRLRGSTGNIIKNGIVYISCGISNGHIDGHRNWFDSYNIKTEEWKVLPNAPRARDHFQAVEADNKIYLLGGRLSKAPKATFNETIGEVDYFDIKKNQWFTVKDHLPTHRAGNMAVRYHNNIMVIGGESIRQNMAHTEVEALNINTHLWKSYPKLIQGRHGTGCVFINNTLYIASGCGNRGGVPELDSVEKY